MLRFSFYILIALLTFGISSLIVFKFFISKEKQIAVQNTQESQPEVIIQVQDSLPQTDSVNEDECGDWSEEVDYQPIIKKWLRGENLKNVSYCSKTGKEAKDYYPSNIIPTLIDLNKDGKKELALQGLCSGTGNCAMEIFEKTNKGYKEIFSSVHDVQVFNLKRSSNKGYFDITATMHGSWNSGDGVIYKYNGRKYKSYKCFLYEYEEYKDKNGKTRAKGVPTINYEKCQDFF